ncbi:MAG: type II secretion system F family protein [Alphaproteobacteria bacterium]|nr:type II secretion system F family protein [Alphaproteobacteria bacterium]
MLAIFLSILIFMVFGVVASFIILSIEAQKKKRLMKVVRGSYDPQADSKKLSYREYKKNELANKLKKETEEGDEKEKSGVSISDMIMQAGLEISDQQFWVFSAIFAIGALVFCVLAGMSTFMLIMVGIISFMGIPRLTLKMMASNRQKKFLEEFPDALESMRRLLKSGMPVSEAIKMVAREYSGPIGEEMGHIFDKQKIGVPLTEAVLETARRIPLTEVQMFATAVAIQTQTGSSLSEVLENLANLIRARFRLKRKVQALSAEAKSSAAIIGALPVLVGLGMYFVSREYIELLYTDPTGKVLLGGAIVWMCVGIFVMRQMINFKV